MANEVELLCLSRKSFIAVSMAYFFFCLALRFKYIADFQYLSISHNSILQHYLASQIKIKISPLFNNTKLRLKFYTIFLYTSDHFHF